MRLLLIISLILKSGFSFGQDFAYPLIQKQGRTIYDFVPKNWTVIDSAKGDLNKDSFDDIAFVLQFNDNVRIAKRNEELEKDSVTTKPRILIIAFYDSVTRNYNLTEQSNTFILCHDNPLFYLDPFIGIKIEHGLLVIDIHKHYIEGGWWTMDNTYKFRYQKLDFYLIGVDSYSRSQVPEEGYDFSINFLTRSYIYKNRTSKFEMKELKTFKTFKIPFNWHLNSEIFL